MNHVQSTRAPLVLGIILFLLVSAAIAFPRLVDAATSGGESRAEQAPVELGGIGVPDSHGGTLVCSNPSGFTGNTITWDCGETRVAGRSEVTPDDNQKALARYHRAMTLSRTVEVSEVDSPREGIYVKKSNEDDGGTFVSVSVADGPTTQYFAFGGPEADELSQRLIDDAPANPSDPHTKEDSQ